MSTCTWEKVLVGRIRMGGQAHDKISSNKVRSTSTGYLGTHTMCCAGERLTGRAPRQACHGGHVDQPHEYEHPVITNDYHAKITYLGTIPLGSVGT